VSDVVDQAQDCAESIPSRPARARPVGRVCLHCGEPIPPDDLGEDPDTLVCGGCG
jgi:hypothetical protein